MDSIKTNDSSQSFLDESGENDDENEDDDDEVYHENTYALK